MIVHSPIADCASARDGGTTGHQGFKTQLADQKQVNGVQRRSSGFTLVVSAIMGICMIPRPPFLRGVLIQAKCVSSVSQEAAISWQFSCSNCVALSLKAIISVGQTNVKSWKQRQ